MWKYRFFKNIIISKRNVGLMRLFGIISTEWSIYATILMIIGHLQVQCVNFKVK